MSMSLKLIQCQTAVYIRGIISIATDCLKSGISSPCVNVAEPWLEERDAAVHLPNGRAAVWTEPTDTGGNIM